MPTTTIIGLSSAEADARLTQYGGNELAPAKRLNAVVHFLSRLKNPLVLVLVVAATISGLTGQIHSLFIILSVVLLSVSMDFYQERKSNLAIEKINQRLAIRAQVIRDGREQELPAKLLVPGDVVLLNAGAIIPADGELLAADDFFVSEAVLTGESLPVEKESRNKKIIFSGTSVVSGFGKMLVQKTGAQTEFGKIAQTINQPVVQNDFEKGLGDFSALIAWAIAFVVTVIFIINAFLDKGILSSLLFALAVAVGITPELLPMIMSVTMAKGSLRMSKQGVLVKKLNSIPTFGSINILCTDKTGTLTEDKIAVIKHVDVFGHDEPMVFEYAYRNGYFETGIKSILDTAILSYKQIPTDSCVKKEEIPYDFDRKRSSVVYEQNNELVMVTKGAPESIFAISRFYGGINDQSELNHEIKTRAIQTYEQLSRDGLRVLAIAGKIVTEAKEQYHHDDENGLTLFGFMAFYDPPKADITETIEFMGRHGITIKILTGDNAPVTKKICEMIHLPVAGIINGDELDFSKLADGEIYRLAMNATIAARLSPGQKEKIIEVLRKNGQVVAYLGDGINDAPALKAADIGISVENATDVARETADIILTRKGLKELMAGVLEGRRTFGNAMKYLLMGFSSGFGNMFSMIGASIFLPFLPMTAGQILTNNFLYDASQISIPSDNVDPEYLQTPKGWNLKFIKRYVIIFGLMSSIFDFITFYLLFSFFHLEVSAFQTGWFLESLGTQILIIYIIRTKKIPFLQSSPSYYLLATTIATIVVAWLLTISSLGAFLGFSILKTNILIVIAMTITAYLILTEFLKQWFYRYHFQGENV